MAHAWNYPETVTWPTTWNTTATNTTVNPYYAWQIILPAAAPVLSLAARARIALAAVHAHTGALVASLRRPDAGAPTVRLLAHWPRGRQGPPWRPTAAARYILIRMSAIPSMFEFRDEHTDTAVGDTADVLLGYVNGVPVYGPPDTFCERGDE